MNWNRFKDLDSKRNIVIYILLLILAKSISTLISVSIFELFANFIDFIF